MPRQQRIRAGDARTAIGARHAQNVRDAHSWRGVGHQRGPPARQRGDHGDVVVRGEPGREVVRPLPDVPPVDVAKERETRLQGGARSPRRCVPRRGRRRRARRRGPSAGTTSDRRAGARSPPRCGRSSVPTRRATPASIASGRSVSSRSTSTGLPSAGASSWMPPGVGEDQRRLVEQRDERVRRRAARRCARPPPAPISSAIARRTSGLGCAGYTISTSGQRAAMAFSARSMPRIGAPKFSRRWAVTTIRRRSRSRAMPCGIARSRTISSASMTVLPVTTIASSRMRSAQQVLPCPRRRREVQRGEARGDLPVHLLGERVAEVAGTKPGLDVEERPVLVERAQRRGEHGGRVALRDDRAGARSCSARSSASTQRPKNPARRWPGCMRSRATSGTQVEQRHGLGEQLAVLAGVDDHRHEARVARERGDHRRHLDHFGARAEDAGHPRGRSRGHGLRLSHRRRVPPASVSRPGDVARRRPASRKAPTRRCGSRSGHGWCTPP